MSKTTYRLPAALRTAMLGAVERSYGKKGKSRWIREAIDELLTEDPALSAVGVSEDLNRNDVADVVDLGAELPERITEGVQLLRRQDPTMEGVRSAIIRAAIRRRLKSLQNPLIG